MISLNVIPAALLMKSHTIKDTSAVILRTADIFDMMNNRFSVLPPHRHGINPAGCVQGIVFSIGGRNRQKFSLLSCVDSDFGRKLRSA